MYKVLLVVGSPTVSTSTLSSNPVHSSQAARAGGGRIFLVVYSSMQPQQFTYIMYILHVSLTRGAWQLTTHKADARCSNLLPRPLSNP